MVDQTAQSGQVGAGQQVPEDSNSEYWMISFIVSQMMAQLETMIPVQVTAVHAGTGSPPSAPTVDVQLLVSQLDGAGNVVAQGVVYGISVWRMQGGKWAVVCDPDVNDFGFIVAASRDISNVVKTPGQAQPGSLRKYSYSDAVYIGGAFNQVPEATFWLKSDGTLEITDSQRNVLQTSSAGWVFTGPVEFKNNVKVDGTFNATGDGTIDGVDIKTHVHSGVQTGGSDTGPPV